MSIEGGDNGAAPAATPPAEILLVDDDAKTRAALEAALADLGASIIAVGSGKQALLKLIDQDFAVVLLDIDMPDMDGFETADFIRGRQRTRHTPIIFLTAYHQNERHMRHGYDLGAVDFLFKPIEPEILRSKVAVFVELHRKTLEIARQARLIREAEQREAERRLEEARQRWERDALHEQMAIERELAETMARKADELAAAVADRDAAARALVHSNTRLALLSDTANRLLLGQRPRVILQELCAKVAAHLDLDVYGFRQVTADGQQLRLEVWGGIDETLVERFRMVPFGGGLSGVTAEQRCRIVIDDLHTPVERGPEQVRELGVSACVAMPLVAEEQLIGTLMFATRTRRVFTQEELATTQMFADQIAIALEREQLITQLQLRNSELADADRRKDEFLAMLAHELRNPMAPIVNSLHVLGRELGQKGSESRMSSAHATIDRQVRHLIRLVDDLLDVSRITQGKIELRREPASLQMVLEQAVTLARPLIADRGHTLEVDAPGDRVVLDVDVTRLTQAVSNLLNNAAKYTDRGGRIWLVASADDDEVVIRVRDNGIGMRPEMLPKVFELFTQADQTVDRTVGGLGIGLTLVKRLVQLHGGEVLAFSEGLGRGSEFVVTLPRALEVATALPKVVAREQSGPSTRKLHILVVEDNADIRETLKELLELEGHEVTLAEDGPTGVDRAQPGCDVALIDIGLPGLDGYAVARQLDGVRKARGFPARLIAISGYGQAEDRRRAIEAGFDDHLVKPVDPLTLTRLLAEQSAIPAHEHEGGA